MNVLVTGGAGFIGSHLVEALVRRGDRVVVLDDLSTGSRENLAAALPSGKVELIVDSACKSELVDTLVSRCDAVFHLASAVGVRMVVEQPVHTIQTIVESTDAVLSAARRHSRRVLITSSSEVYGKGVRIPFSESDDVVLGASSTRRWAYACAKMLDEFLAQAHWFEAKLPVVCVRLFNTVGPRQSGRYGMVLPRFVQQALRGEPITVYGNGEQTRCFCHVEDVVGGLLKLIDCDQAWGRVVNLGSDEEVTINDLAARVKAVSGSSSSVEHVPYDRAYDAGFEDLGRRVPDLKLVRNLIGFSPRYALDQIIASTIESWRKLASAASTPHAL